MAPELLLSNSTKLSLEDLMKADIWSLGMTLFVLLDLDILYPYQIEADQSQSYDLASFKKLITEKFTSETMPEMFLNYEKKRMLHWLQILQILDLCVKFKSINRPSITDIFSRGFFKKEKKLHYNHLVINQATALEHFDRQIAERINCEQDLDYDATNLCTFLAVEIAANVLRYGVENLKDRVEAIIQMLPSEINRYRNIEQLYDAIEALQVLKLSEKNLKYNFELRELIYSEYNLLSSNGVSELSSALHHIAESTMRAATYICKPFTMSSFFNQ